MRLFNKKEEKKAAPFASGVFQTPQAQAMRIDEPLTLARIRLENEAKDRGAQQAIRVYNEHRTKISNQWINPLQSINSGFGTAQFSYFNYQVVNYWECYALAQDPLFTRIFSLLSETPFSKGGELVDDMDKEALYTECQRINLTKLMKECVKASFVSGGCLVYLDFGDDVDLTEPLDYKTADFRLFKGFKRIDPINVTAIKVNTVNPSEADYMNPQSWYVIGLGEVHESRFLKFEQNTPELVMKPLCMYFGMPLTQLIKQDVANTNLVTQGVANLINRFRNVYMKTPRTSFTTDSAAEFVQRLQYMSYAQDNFQVTPIADDEEVMQLTTSLGGLAENVELFFQVLAAKTSITKSVLLAQGTSGLSGTLEGERRNWYDTCINIQESVKPNLLKMLGIIQAKITDGKFIEFEDYEFNPLEAASEKEISENLRSDAEVAKALIEMGGKQEQVLEWLTQKRGFAGKIEFDDETPNLGDYDTGEVIDEVQQDQS